MATKRKKTSDAIDILRKRYYDGKPDRAASLEEELLHARIAQMIYDLRTSAGLTQKQLAKLLKTTDSVISRLESADYSQHSLAMLEKIARVFHGKVHIHIVPGKPRQKTLKTPDGKKLDFEHLIA